jgi:pyruvate/2-oxoglutarate dehydrogenase complex dihydrolipoamide dehydrogenase (E3) component
MDYEIAVIGSGSAGKEAALLAAKQGFRVVVIEKETLGGTCYHRGYFAIRILRACADAFHNRLFASRYGIDLDHRQPKATGWAEIRRRVSSALADQLNAQLRRANVDVRFGRATFLDDKNLRLFDAYGYWTDLTAGHVVIATGSRPSFFLPAETKLLNSDQLLQITEIPGHLLIIGGGYVGCEFASIFRALGSIVTLVEKQARLLPDWDADASEHLLQHLRLSGVTVELGTEINLARLPREPGVPLQVEVGDLTIKPDLVLVATGRLPNVETLGLEELGIKTQPFVEVETNMQTNHPNIYAVGDVNGLSMLDSTALAQAQIAIDAIAGKRSYFIPSWAPRCLYTSPQMAVVGWMEQEAIDAGLDIVVAIETTELLADEEFKVLDPYPTKIKVVLNAQTKKILGCLAIGNQALEIVNLCSILLTSDTSPDQLNRYRFVHSSPAEALQRCVNSVAAA